MLFCVILGSDSAFSVEVDETHTVGDVKEKVKTKKTPELDADALMELPPGEPIDSSACGNVVPMAHVRPHIVPRQLVLLMSAPYACCNQ